MYRLNLFRFLFCAFAAFAVALSASAQTQPGAIKAMRVTGEVMKLAANGTTSKITEGQLIAESDTVITRNNSSVVLVFANGSSVRLSENSRIGIDEFKMDPLSRDIKLSELTAEPSVSKTRLSLAYGEMVGNVKKLSASSSYDINTPVGAAGIRGTTFRIVLSFDSKGQASFSLATVEGLVSFVPANTPTSVITATDVPAGTQVTVVGNVDPVSGQVTITEVQAPTTIPESTKEAVEAAVAQEINSATQSTTITVTEQQAGGSETPSGQEQTSQSNQGANQSGANDPTQVGKEADVISPS